MNKEHEQACSKLRLTHRLNSVELLSTSTSTKLRRKSEKRKKYGNKHLHINRVCFTIMACRLWVNMHSMVSSAESKFVECKYIPLPVPLNKSNIVQINFSAAKHTIKYSVAFLTSNLKPTSLNVLKSYNRSYLRIPKASTAETLSDIRNVLSCCNNVTRQHTQLRCQQTNITITCFV